MVTKIINIIDVKESEIKRLLHESGIKKVTQAMINDVVERYTEVIGNEVNLNDLLDDVVKDVVNETLDFGFIKKFVTVRGK